MTKRKKTEEEDIGKRNKSNAAFLVGPARGPLPGLRNIAKGLH